MTLPPGELGAVDPGALFDEDRRAEFQTTDLAATMATMVAEPSVLQVPTATGGVGRDGVRRFYGRHFIGKWPADLAIRTMSRTVGQDRIIDELVLSFTHVEMDALVPGVRPTGRVVELAFVVIVGWRATRSRTSTSGTRHRCWSSSASSTRIACLSCVPRKPGPSWTQRCRAIA